MSESYVQGELLLRLRRKVPNAVVFKHSDMLVHGIPDVSVTLNRLTTHWELKYADPRFVSPPQQRHMMKRLEMESHCARYIIFELEGGFERTYIVRPSKLDTYRVESLSHSGFAYDWVVDRIVRAHYARVA